MAALARQLLRELGSANTTTNGIISTLKVIDGDMSVAAFDDDPLLRTQFANTILTVMKDRSMAGGVQEEACRALGILVKNRTDMQNLIAQRADGIDTILKAMRNHETVMGVQKEACCLLRILAYGNDGNSVSIAQQGGIDSILAALQNHQRLFVDSVQKEAYHALITLAENNNGNQQLIAAKGGIDTVLLVMRNRPRTAVLQLSACCVLWLLAVDNTNNQKSIVKKGGVEAIEQALIEHSENSFIQEAGRNAFALLKKATNTVHPARQLVPELRKNSSARRVLSALKSFLNWAHRISRFPTQFSFADAINAVVAAMQNHETVGDIQKHGCSTLCLLVHHADQAVYGAFTDGNRTASLSIEQRVAIIDASLTAMRNHLLVEGLQGEACLLLKNVAGLIADDSDNRRLIGQKGGIDSILTAMQNHEGIMVVQLVACGALCSLAKNMENNMLIGQKGGIDAILAAMQNNLMAELLQFEACAALEILAGIDDNQKSIMAKGGIEAILLAEQNNDGLTYVAQKAIKCIKREQ